MEKRGGFSATIIAKGTSIMPITPNALDNFLKLFAGEAAVDEQQAAQYHERFVSTRPEDNHFDNGTYHKAVAEHVATLPDDQFQQAAKNAIAQAPPQERQDLLANLLGALGGAGGLAGMISGLGNGSGGGAGGGLDQIAKMLGLGTTDPRQMSNDDAAKVINYARNEHPELIQQTVAEKPWFVKAMGNPIVMGALTVAAAKLLKNMSRPSN
jgi:hypothetical protein